MNTYLKLKKILKHKLLSNFLITKGYIVNKIHNTNEEVSFHKEKLNQDFINVLVKDWNFSNKAVYSFKWFSSDLSDSF